MSDLKRHADDFVERLKRQIESAHTRREVASAVPSGNVTAYGDDVESRIRDYDAQLARRIEHARQKFDSALSAYRTRAPVSGQVDLSTDPELARLDTTFFNLFDVRRYFPAGSTTYRTVFCESLEEFFLPLLDSYSLSTTQKSRLLDEMKAEAEEAARQTSGGGIFGFHLPSVGCYLNGWLFNYGRPGKPRDLLRDPQVAPRILATAAHEKLGHGFIAEFTALGTEKKTLGLQNVEYADRFHFRTADTPRERLLIEKYNLVQNVSQFTEEGWATWVELTMMQALFSRAREPRYSIRAVWDAVRRLSVDRALREPLLAAMQSLFLDPDATWESVHPAILTLQGLTHEVDDAFAQNVGQPVRYVLGSLLLDKLESRYGAVSVLYGVVIAASVSYDLPNISSADLARLLVTDPKLNPDSRLAALTTLAVPEGDVKALAIAAHEQFSMAVPGELLSS